MPRKSRLIISGLPHHITQRGNNKQKIFFADNDYLKYLVRFEEYRKKSQLSVISFCLMPNHVHFVAIPKDHGSLSFTFNNTHSRYAQYYNEKYLHCGHVWQGRFYSCAVGLPRLLKVLKYVEMNPLRAGLVKKIGDWEWSSAISRITKKKSIIILDEIPEIMPKSSGLWEQLLREQAETSLVDAIRKHTRSGKPFDDELIEKFWKK